MMFLTLLLILTLNQGLIIFLLPLKWVVVLCHAITLIIIYILTMYNCVCFNININHTCSELTDVSKLAWYKVSDEQTLHYNTDLDNWNYDIFGCTDTNTSCVDHLNGLT